MPYANLTITIPDSIWISELSSAHPNTTFRVRAATANTATGVARIEIRGADPEAITEEIRDYDSVTDLSVLEREVDLLRVQVETTVPLLMTSLQNAGVPIEMPFDVQNGEMTLETTIPQQDLSELGEALETFGIPYTVERIKPNRETDSLLTDRQQWLLTEAIDRGYYDTPRRTSLVDLAEELDIAKSTCSEILHRAEERVLKAHTTDEGSAQPDIPVASD